MRLLTHNTLKSPCKDSSKGLPLRLEIAKLEVRESEIDTKFILHMLPSLDWNALLISAEAVGMAGLPQVFDPALVSDQTFIQAIHHLLFDIHVIEGNSVPPLNHTQLYCCISFIEEFLYAKKLGEGSISPKDYRI